MMNNAPKPVEVNTFEFEPTPPTDAPPSLFLDMNSVQLTRQSEHREQPRKYYDFNTMYYESALKKEETRNFEVNMWMADPKNGKYKKVKGFLDSGAKCNVINRRVHVKYLIKTYPLDQPAALRFMN